MSSNKLYVILLYIVCFGITNCIYAGTYSDQFDTYLAGSDGEPTWITPSVLWEMSNGHFESKIYDNGEFAVLAAAPYSHESKIELIITPRENTGYESWVNAGVAIVQDKFNFWQFAIVQGPGQLKLELSEMHDGIWNAQYQPATLLTPTESNNMDYDWEFGTSYKISLEMNSLQVRGVLSQMDGSVLASATFSINSASPAVRNGRAALLNSGLSVEFDNVICEWGTEVSPTITEFPVYTQAGQITLPNNVLAVSTGFFHTQKIGEKWWIVDPSGHSFFMIGADWINFDVWWSESMGTAPYHNNVAAQFGTEETWASDCTQKMGDWGFNSVGLGHSSSMRYQSMSWVLNLTMGQKFAAFSSISDKNGWSGFPNVFHPRWHDHCRKVARDICEYYKDDPWLLGYYIDNELEWYGKEWEAPDWGLVNEILQKEHDHTAKQALFAWLVDKYPTITELNTAWGISVQSYNDLLMSTTPVLHTTEQGKIDKLEFVHFIAEKYFTETSQAIREYDPNHMILGCRFAGIVPEGVASIAGLNCDIFSINSYPHIDIETDSAADYIDYIGNIYKQSNCPIVVSEWSFPSLDAGLPCQHGAGMCVDTQEQRSDCFKIFQRSLMESSFVVGSSFFMWTDEPDTGVSSVFPEDCNYGLLNVNHVPYTQLVSVASELNSDVYEIHSSQAFTYINKDILLLDMPLDVGCNGNPIQMAMNSNTWSIENNALHLQKNALDGYGFDMISLNGVHLGKYMPGLLQDVGFQQWVGSDSAVLVTTESDEGGLIFDVDFSRQGNGAYCARYRFYVYPGMPWFGVKCLWVENIGTTTWYLDSTVQYIMPEIGGISTDDIVAQLGVPHYYRNEGVTWYDNAAGYHYGICSPNYKKFSFSFWKDESNNHHSDVTYCINKQLLPGERCEIDQPICFVFGASGGTSAIAWGSVYDDIYDLFQQIGHCKGLTYKYVEKDDMQNVVDLQGVAVSRQVGKSFEINHYGTIENFGYNFKGFLEIPRSGYYTFYSASDDGSVLSIDDNLIVNNDGIHGLQEVEGGVFLDAGFHNIVLDYFQIDYGRVLEVKWSGPGISKGTIPLNYLYVNPGLSRDYWTDLPGSLVTDLTNSTRYPDRPTGSDRLYAFECLDWNGSSVNKNWADNYAQRIRGYVKPSESGTYTFALSGSDASELWLSTDSSVDNKSKIAFVTIPTQPYEWNSSESQRSLAIDMLAGKKYYIEVLHKAGQGNDHCSVAWKNTHETNYVIIPQNALEPFNEPEISIGADFDLANVWGGDWDNLPRLNVSKGNSVGLLRGKYSVECFEFNATGIGGKLRPCITQLISENPVEYKVIWIGPEIVVAKEGQDYVLFNSEFELLNDTEVYACVYQDQTAKIRLLPNIGETDHDWNDPLQPLSVGQILDGFSNPGLSRTYAFKLRLNKE